MACRSTVTHRGRRLYGFPNPQPHRRDISEIEDVFWIAIVGAVTGSAIRVDMGGLHHDPAGAFPQGSSSLKAVTTDEEGDEPE